MTVMEKELSEIGLGPDLSWHEAYRPGQAVDILSWLKRLKLALTRTGIR